MSFTKVWIVCWPLIVSMALQGDPLISSTPHRESHITSPGEGKWLNDASRLNKTQVREIIKVPTDPVLAEGQIRSLLRTSRENHLRISIGGARHSMGGHTLYPGGIYLDMTPFNWMELDADSRILHVGSGAFWEDIIPYLDERGFSPWVMQSNNSFSVGGSISVNCHGWQQGKPPIASTVESFRLMKSDGEAVTCSRSENEELFSLVLGGYGLFGVILDVNLRVVPNERYRLTKYEVHPSDYPEQFAQKVEGNDQIQMAYARLSVAPKTFLDEVILNVYESAPAEDGEVPELEEPGLQKIRRSIFRKSVGSDWGKRVRWSAEKNIEPLIASEFYSRNQLLSEGVETFQNRSSASTDILHEYFIPRGRFAEFVQSLKALVIKRDMDLLNVTVRDLDPDQDTFLRYADQEMFALVLLFNQPFGINKDRTMEVFTQELIDAALQVNGRYYLPYRL
ncbi:MAG: FAD-binding oxidoreductase, partial [Candidatus Omnitrophica bacterium]|nr:FAD-binding oxidoreductase [Candidatus Omnitrophota bacterium]